MDVHWVRVTAVRSGWTQVEYSINQFLWSFLRLETVLVISKQKQKRGPCAIHNGTFETFIYSMWKITSFF